MEVTTGVQQCLVLFAQRVKSLQIANQAKPGYDVTPEQVFMSDTNAKDIHDAVQDARNANIALVKENLTLREAVQRLTLENDAYRAARPTPGEMPPAGPVVVAPVQPSPVVVDNDAPVNENPV